MASLEWIKQIDEAILALEEKPQFGRVIEFSWEDFERRLREVFESSFSLSHQVKGWTDPAHLLEGMGKNLKIVSVHWTPLEIPAFFICSEQDLQQMMSLFLGGDEAASFFYENNVETAFFDYTAAEICRVLDQMEFASPLSCRLGSSFASLNEIRLEEHCFLIDVSLSLKNRNVWGRILVPKSLREEWKKYFIQSPAPPLSAQTHERAILEIGLQVGKTRLSLEEWKKIRKGDFVVLDHCSFNPETNKGGVLLTLQEAPILRARFKEGAIKITNYPVYEEVSSMERIEDEDEDEDLYGDKESDDDLFTDFPDEEGGKEEGENKSSLNLEELPIQLTVEITRLKMSAKELMDLAPGNLLDLQVSPEQGVDLVVGGKKVGKGELIRLGEVLGVRILSL